MKDTEKPSAGVFRPDGFILHRAIPVTSVVGYVRKKGNSLHHAGLTSEPGIYSGR